MRGPRRLHRLQFQMDISMQNPRDFLAPAIASALLATGSAKPALAHGAVGNRVFPVRLSIDDPAVADELSAPTVSHTLARQADILRRLPCNA